MSTFYKTIILTIAISLMATVSFNSSASIVTITPSSTDWGTAPGDNNSFISGLFTNQGNGSLELLGDRTRFFGLGNPFNPASNLGLLSALIDFRFDWAITENSMSNFSTDYTPALRLHIFDGTQRSELIWEGAYNGTYGNTNRNTWYSTSFLDNFHQWVANVGPTEIYNRSINDWKSIYSSAAYISAVSIGVGSGVGSNYQAFADNLTIQFAGNTATTFNFELESTQVPAPAALILMLSGLFLLSRRV